MTKRYVEVFVNLIRIGSQRINRISKQKIRRNIQRKIIQKILQLHRPPIPRNPVNQIFEMILKHTQIRDLRPIKTRPNRQTQMTPSRSFAEEDPIPNQRTRCIASKSSEIEVIELGGENFFDVVGVVALDVEAVELLLRESVAVFGE
jgi:hypothetical protein